MNLVLKEVSEPKGKDVATESGHVKVICDLDKGSFNERWGLKQD